ncbi:MAG: hypothetical protein K8L99_22445, partial [Anaerolineae bacterium]|nr:hypothetical protein [Anaerolineae bacterium]
GKIIEKSGQMRFNFGPTTGLGAKQGSTGTREVQANLTGGVDVSTGSGTDASIKADAKLTQDGKSTLQPPTTGNLQANVRTAGDSEQAKLDLPDGATLTAEGKIIEKSGQMRFNFGPTTGLGAKQGSTGTREVQANLTGGVDGTGSGTDASIKADAKLTQDGKSTLQPPATGNLQANVRTAGEVEQAKLDLPDGATLTAEGKIVEKSGQMRFNFGPTTALGGKTTGNTQEVKVDTVSGGNAQETSTGTVNANLALNPPSTGNRAGAGTMQVEGTILPQQDDSNNATTEKVVVTPDGSSKTTAPNTQQVNIKMAPPTKGVNTGKPAVTLDVNGQIINDGGSGSGAPPVTPPSGGGSGGGTGGGGTPPPTPPEGPQNDGSTPPPDSPYLNMYNTTNDQKPFSTYQQAGYRWIGPRTIAGNIRLAKDTTLGPSTSGAPELHGNAKGMTAHVRTGTDASEEQIAMQMMTAGYSQYVGSDPTAYDAARASAMEAGAHKPQNWKESMAAGILAYNGSSWAQTANAKQRFQQSMYSQAVQGSQAYVNNQPGNAYTQY